MVTLSPQPTVAERRGVATAAPFDAASPRRKRRGWPRAWLLVGATVVWNLATLRSALLGVSYADDSSVHEQMVRFATMRLSEGHVPLTSWFPYLGLGSPQFLHYQSLPAMLTGVLGLAVGPDRAFRWTLYVLLCSWPISIYISARLFTLPRRTAAFAAALSPFVLSVSGVGFEQRSYLWIGYGLWAQLWAAFTLPLAWGFTWRAVRYGRHRAVAALFVALTIALHFETGYLALLPLVLWPFVTGGRIIVGLRRAAVVAGAALLAAAWVIVPLIVNRPWAATNEALAHTALVNGYGAPKMLWWLVSGQLLDAGRVPVLTVLAAVGFALTCERWSRGDSGPALVVVMLGCLCLSFGRTTFGPLADIVPGSSDVFFRRFAMGAQLAAVLLAGVGASWCFAEIRDALTSSRRARLLVGVAGVVVLAPAWLQCLSLDAANAARVQAQRRADRTGGAEVDRLLDVVRRQGGGRVYAGMPSNWGARLLVGTVPVFKYIESRDVDEVGYTLRTASLMTGPEDHFVDSNPSDYVLFGVHYLILPSGRPPPVAAHFVMRAGAYALWIVSASGYLHLGRSQGLLEADRTNLGQRTIGVMRSPLAQTGTYVPIAFAHADTPPQLPPSPATGSVGRVITETDQLQRGASAAVVRVRGDAIVVLSASFDVGWKVTVDGRSVAAQMVAPALVAASVPPGVHRVVFRYAGYSGYPALFALSAVAVLLLIAVACAGVRVNVRH